MLRGSYLDVEQDIVELVANADVVIAQDLNHLKVQFLGDGPK
jgi:hypothetical protein